MSESDIVFQPKFSICNLLFELIDSSNLRIYFGTSLFELISKFTSLLDFLTKAARVAIEKSFRFTDTKLKLLK